MIRPKLDFWVDHTDFEDSLITRLRSNEFQNLKVRRSDLENKGLFLSKDEAKQLQKDVSKWKAQVVSNTIGGPAFHGTLLTLQKYCRLMRITPNEALSPIGDLIVSPDELIYFTLDDIQILLQSIRDDLDGFKAAISDWPVIVPIKYSPRCFVTMHLKIEKKENDPKDLYIRFLVCDYNDVLFDDDNYANLASIDGAFFHLREYNPKQVIEQRYREANNEFDLLYNQAIAGGDSILASDLSMFLGDAKDCIDGHFFNVFKVVDNPAHPVDISDNLTPVSEQVSNYAPGYVSNYGER